MNGVTLNSPELKLVRTSEQTPSRAMSSSQADGRSANDLVSSSAARIAPAGSVSQVESGSKAEQAQNRNDSVRDSIDDAVSQLNDYAQNVQRDLQFEVDSERGETIVRVVDQQTQKVIRQIPDELALRLAENLQQDEPLTLLDIKV